MLYGTDSNASQNREQGQLLTSRQRQLLQKNLQDDLSKRYRQRIQIILLADRGKTQAQICEVLGCSQAMARHWIFMARIGRAHDWQDSPIGRPKAVNEVYLERLQELASHSPRDYGYAFRRWTGHWLSKHLAKEFGIEICDRHINRLLKQMGLSTRQQPANTEEDMQPSINTDLGELTEVLASNLSVSL